MRLRLAASAFALALTLTVAAGASAGSRSALASRIKHSRDVVAFFTTGRGAWMPARRHSSCRSVPWRRTCGAARRELARHRALLRRLERSALPAHYKGWWCIHAGRWPGAVHEGGGANPAGYYGPLQMSEPWLGHHGDWLAMPTVDVFRVAEAEAARHGFSWSWMRGQWPRTYPPCAGFF